MCCRREKNSLTLVEAAYLVMSRQLKVGVRL